MQAMDTNALETLQEELERLFNLEEMIELSEQALGFMREQVGATESAGAFARALVGHCSDREALPALIDAILLSSEGGANDLSGTLDAVQNGELKAGTEVGNLRIVKKLGEGGLSVVYLADNTDNDLDPEGDKQVALKVIRSEFARDLAAVQRYTTAARFMQRAAIQGLVPIKAVGQLDDNRPWVAAQYLKGQTLAERLKRSGSLHINEAKTIFESLLSALGALHSKGLSHGDVKVENVVLTGRDGGNDSVAVLVDACSDRLLLNRGVLSAGTTGTLPVLGTAKSVAPEIARGQAPDARSDLYAFGILMYEVLTGSPPFEADSAIDVIADHLGTLPEPPSESARKGWVSERLDALVLRALEKEPAERFASAESLAEALQDTLRRPGKAKALDESAYAEAHGTLLSTPTDGTAADTLEQMGLESDAFEQVAESFRQALEGAEPETRSALLPRLARIYEHELRDGFRAEATYQQLLDLDPNDDAALRGVEDARRKTGDHSGLIEALLERLERTEDEDARVLLLKEVAVIYERDLNDAENSAVAFTQVLLSRPSDAEARKGLAKTAGSDEALWTEALTALSETAETLVESLTADDDEQRSQAEAALAQAEAQAQQYREHYDAVLNQRRSELEAQAAALQEQAAQEAAQQAEIAAADKSERDAAKAQRDSEQAMHAEQLGTMTEERDELAKRIQTIDEQQEAAQGSAQELQEQVAERNTTLEAAHAAAEAKVAEYEALETEAGEEPNGEQVQALNTLAEEAEDAVDRADSAEKAVEVLTSELTAAQEAVATLAIELESNKNHLSQLEQALADHIELNADALSSQADDNDEAPANEGDDLLDVADSELTDMMAAMDTEPQLTDEEQVALDAVEAHLEQARAAISALDARDQDDQATQKQRDLDDAVNLFMLLGNYYDRQLRRPDYALPYFNKALELDPEHGDAYAGILTAYRNMGAYSDLANVLLQRAAHAQSPKAARDDKAEAATLLSEKLGDAVRARVLFAEVLEDDPAHPKARAGLTTIVSNDGDHDTYKSLLEDQVGDQVGDARVDNLIKLAALKEQHLDDLSGAIGHLNEVLDLTTPHVAATTSLVRIAQQLGDNEALLRGLQLQSEGEITPKQRITLLAQIAQLHEEEFVNDAAAASCQEKILEIDPRNGDALVALARLQHKQGHFEDVAEVLSKMAGLCQEPADKTNYLLQAAQVLADEVGAPERAIAIGEEILTLDPKQPQALALLARLRGAAGDLAQAMEAIALLAEQAEPGEARAQQFFAAGDMAEQAGNKDAAVMRYKHALDEYPACIEAAERLVEIYLERDNMHGASEMLTRAIEHTSGPLKRAGLLAELGTLYLNELHDPANALQAFNEAADLDPTHTLTAVGLGQLAIDRGLFEKAAEHFDVAISRLHELPEERAADIYAIAGNAFLQIKRTKDAVQAFKRVCELRPDALHAHEQYATAVCENGAPAEAAELYADLISAFDSRLDEDDRLRLLLAQAEAELAARNTRRAVTLFQTIADLDPSSEALEALTRAQYQARDWDAVVALLQRRTSEASNRGQRAELLAETGDVFLEKLKDRNAAAQNYSQALEEGGNDRNLLSKLMAVYSDAGDWPRLIEVILRIAELVDSPEQLAKYYNTAATIAQQELGRFDEAANYYEEALSHLAVVDSEAQFAGLRQCLTENQDWERLEAAYLLRLRRQEDAEAEITTRAALIDSRAEIMRDHLGRMDDALELFEEAQALQPDNTERRAMLTAVYTREPKRYFARAVAAHREILDQTAEVVEPLKALRRIYTSGKRPDESFCICQALRTLDAADADEEKFFKKYRLTRLARFKNSLDETLFRNYVLHPAQDATLTALFQALTPAIVAVQGQSLDSFGIAQEMRTIPEQDSTAMGRMLAHTGDAMALRLPDVYHAPNDPGGLSFLFVSPPAIGIGQGAAAGGPHQALAFIAARHVTYYRPGNFPRQLVPTGTGLRGWLMAAIRLVAPNFAVPANMEAQVTESLSAIKEWLSGPQRDALRSLTQKLLDSAPELDMRRWMAGVDLTADRAGFVLSNDLKLALAVIEASPEDSSTVSREDRRNELLRYATSEEYFELRKQLGIALGR